MQDIPYQGKELELFQHATVWKGYFGEKIKPYLNGSILEVGAGIGSTTMHLCNGIQDDWICLEPDPVLFQALQSRITQRELPSCCRAINGIAKDIPSGKKFNAILYIDVIEHIEDDRKELAEAADLLEPGGYLIVLVPAHQSVFSPFDKSIGHYRRYNKKMLREAAPSGLQIKKMFYLDSMGLMASVINKYLLKQNYPSLKQINLWDKTMVRVSKITDFIINYQTGKSLIGILQKV
jgi:ubiquinone/menaquinone biosynthesis C-methylase UbiE